MKKVVMVFLLVALIGAFAALQTPVAQTKSKGDLVLTSKKVKSAPGDAGSSAWNKAKESKYTGGKAQRPGLCKQLRRNVPAEILL